MSVVAAYDPIIKGGKTIAAFGAVRVDTYSTPQKYKEITGLYHALQAITIVECSGSFHSVYH